KIISHPGSPSDGIRTAMIEHYGAPVELIEFSGTVNRPAPGKTKEPLLNFHSPALFVKDISKSVSFYTSLLGFKIRHDFGKNIILSHGLTLWETGTGHIISEELDTDSPVNRFELYFDAPDIEAAFHILENAGVKFLHGLHEEPWGQRTIRFFDPDNHLLEAGEPLEVFVRNLSARGLNSDQISQTTGIHPGTVNSILRNT
ncbi:MAG TPA: VOC family protein, partial [Bacteroidales bacterium]|nr:VOC family protein [Bacteroidales bacterium]